MLSTFCSLIVAALATVAAFVVADYIYDRVIVLKIYAYTMTRACDYLATNGRGFFEDKNLDALSEEWVLRIMLTFLYQTAFLILGLWLIPYKYSYWLISGLAVKIGAILGLIVCLAINVIIEYVHVAQIGRLLSIDENGVGHFQGVYCEDFDVDLSRWDNPDERPPLDRRYLVLDILDNTGFEMLDYA